VRTAQRRGLAAKILVDLTGPALRQRLPVELALAHAVKSLVAIVVSMQGTVDSLERELAVAFRSHPLAAVLISAPGLGPVLGAQVLAEVGDDPNRFTTATGLRAFAGTAPVTRASGRSRHVTARKVGNKRLGDACHWSAFALLTDYISRSAHPLRPQRSRRRQRQCQRQVKTDDRAATRFTSTVDTQRSLPCATWRTSCSEAYGWCLQRNELWNEEAAWKDHTSGRISRSVTSHSLPMSRPGRSWAGKRHCPRNQRWSKTQCSKPCRPAAVLREVHRHRAEPSLQMPNPARAV
jgi:hypothetical protein